MLTIQSVQRAGIAIGGRCPAASGFGAGGYGGHEPHEVVKAVVRASVGFGVPWSGRQGVSMVRTARSVPAWVAEMLAVMVPTATSSHPA